MKIFSLSFWASALVSAFITMVCFWLLKKANEKVKIPLVSEVIETA